ncbi:MAG: diguanylate cyclase domain-containing protein [Steroidobacteraceae bacterium]
MIGWSTREWQSVFDFAPEGIVVCDAQAQGHPVVYVNRAFIELCGHPETALLGTNLRVLQGADRDQEARQRIRDALGRGEPCRALLRNYRPDGAQFWNEMLLQPVRDAGRRVTHWIGYHREAGEGSRSSEVRGSAEVQGHGAGGERVPGWAATAGLPGWMREDRLTALASRAYFEEILRRDWQAAQRESREIGLALFNIDNLGVYNETFDKSAGDACIRRVARAIAGSYRRGSDLAGRWEGGTLCVLTQGEAAANALGYAKVVVQRVRDLLIHHPRAVNGCRYVTLSAGVASLVPSRDLPLEVLIAACLAALGRAKALGKNNLCAAEAADFERETLALKSDTPARDRARGTSG